MATVGPATPEDHPRISELTVAAYAGDGLAPKEYLPTLADVAARARTAELLVARDDDGRIVGSVALVLTGEFGEILTSGDEAGFRMLSVDHAARGQGIGELLVRSCLDRARAAGKARMVLSADARSTAAHRLYQRLGFRRLPARDWSPIPGVQLLAYVLDL